MTENLTALDPERARHYREIKEMLPPERQREHLALVRTTAAQLRVEYPRLTRKDRRELARKLSRSRSRFLKGLPEVAA